MLMPRTVFPAVALWFAAFASIVCAQQPAKPPAPTGPVAPLQIEDPLLRQILPEPRTGAGRVIDMARHQRQLDDLAAAKAAGPVTLLLVGDSITDNFHKPGPKEDEIFKPIWDEYFAPHGAFNMAVSGDSTQHTIWRLEHGEADGLTPDNIVLLIGTNNTWHDAKAPAADIAEGIAAVMYSLHSRMPMAKILVLGIFPTTVSTDKSAKDAEINRTIAARFATTKWVRTLDLAKLFLKPDGSVDLSLFYDPSFTPPRAAVHPNTVGQRKWAEAVNAALYGAPAH